MRRYWVVLAGADDAYSVTESGDDVFIKEKLSASSRQGNPYIYLPSASGRANSIISCGKISGTPPTFVLTINSPAEAASMILIPKASVREVER